MTRRILAAAASGIVALSTPVPAQAEPEPPVYGRVVTVAGTGEQGYSGDGWPATQARLGDLLSIAVGPDGSVHITDHLNKRLRRVDPEGVIDTVPGTRGLRSPETDGPEHDGWIYSPSNGPTASAVAADGTLYLATDQEIRRYGRDGKHTVIGGNGELGFTDGNGGDGGPATEAWIYEPRDIAVTDDGSVYVADYHNGRIRRIDPHGVISTVAGGGNSSAAEGKPATRADLDAPAGVAVAADGTVYFVQEGDGTVYRVGPDGLLSHAVDLAGRGRVGGIDVADDGTLYLTDLSRGLVLEAGADGTTAPVGPRLGGRLQDLAVGPNGDLYVAGIAQVLRLVRDGETAPADPPEPATSRWADDEPGTVHPVAGTGTLLEVPVPPGQEPPPGASGVAVGPDGSVYVAEPAGHRVRRIGQDGKAEPFAGTGVKGGDGDGKPAERATLSGPSDVAADAEGNVYIADAGNNRIRRVDADGIISTVTTVEAPRGVAVDRTGAVYVTTGETVARLDARERAVPVAGGGDRWADEADDAPARQADLTGPNAVAVGPDGTVYLTEDGRPAVRAVRPDNVLVTVAGSAYRDRDEGGFAGDGGPATRAELNHPDGVAVGPDGARYVADTYNNRIRRIAPNGTIATVAGTGERADRGDGGPATEAALTEPTDLAFGADGALYVTGTATGRVRRIAPDGTISTLADLAPPDRAERATDTQLSQVRSLAVGVDGTVYVAETSGKVYAVAGDGTLQPVGSDLPARPSVSGHLAAGADGSLYLGIDEIARRTPDGTATIVAATSRSRRNPGRTCRPPPRASGSPISRPARTAPSTWPTARPCTPCTTAGSIRCSPTRARWVASRSVRTARCTRSSGTGCSGRSTAAGRSRWPATASRSRRPPRRRPRTAVRHWRRR